MAGSVLKQCRIRKAGQWPALNKQFLCKNIIMGWNDQKDLPAL